MQYLNWGGSSSVLLAVLLDTFAAACGKSTEPGHSLQQTPTKLEAITPTRLTSTVGTAVVPSPTVRVTLSNGRPRAGVDVLFDGFYPGAIARTSSVTGADGVASAEWVLDDSAERGSAAGPPTIALIKPDGTDLTTPARGHHASWSPAGSKIVFAGNADCPGLHVMNVDGTGLRRVTDNAAETAPSWRQ